MPMRTDVPAGEVVERGELMAAMLAGAWRSSPPPLQMRPEALAQITPLLVKTRGESLGWWRVHQSDFGFALWAIYLTILYGDPLYWKHVYLSTKVTETTTGQISNYAFNLS